MSSRSDVVLVINKSVEQKLIDKLPILNGKTILNRVDRRIEEEGQVLYYWESYNKWSSYCGDSGIIENFVYENKKDSFLKIIYEDSSVSEYLDDHFDVRVVSVFRFNGK